MGGTQSFTLIGTAQFTEGEPGQIRWETVGDQTFIHLNTDADKYSDATIQVFSQDGIDPSSWFLL
jgi:hypothetical protein